MSKYQLFLTILEAALLLFLFTSSPEVGAADNGNNQPLSQLDKVIRQGTEGIKMDGLMDGKLVSNMTGTLNEMATNLRRMFAENRRLSSQVQEVLQRVQNATGVNATSTIGALQKQANITSLSSLSNVNLNNMVSRFQTN